MQIYDNQIYNGRYFEILKLTIKMEEQQIILIANIPKSNIARIQILNESNLGT